MSCNDGEDERPVTPLESDCCGYGCNPCIHDVHRDLIDKWERRRISEAGFSVRKNVLSLTKYKSFVISELKQACANCIFIRLNYGGLEDADTQLFLSPGQHVILRTSISSRPYTPISWTTNSLLLLVKIYSNGKFSKSLGQMKVGEDIEVRGPYGEFRYQPNSFEEILMLSIGTGIAALYPIAKSIVDDELEESRIHLICGFKSHAHIPLANELRDLSHYWNFSCTIKLSQIDSAKRINGVRIESSHLEENTVTRFLESRSPKSTLVLICGTPEFNKAATQWISALKFINFHVFD
ncbi:NADH-cytochrome b5 reductase-like isoform X1 [Neodiprion virginianus]|uniref:NADH-cytochrome b5 reductase-like isoform X1 n=1 Tax=Neodiprion virginianus TaxID=2961670 RepID=UPI001EE6C929|nr:NADH-cytochrome b5 reductase-like isoform X1 [Neodiprion virginianus]XP_046615120.1 NADH-cytochrome b5 reductase-like isoform X1 [Neodiprion virginianus]